MTRIDWSKAPEGYPLWLEDIIHPEDDSKSCWAREGQGEYEFPGGGFWSYSVENLHYFVHRPPARAPEQIAADTKKAHVDIMFKIVTGTPNTIRDGVEALYDAGCRIEVQP